MSVAPPAPDADDDGDGDGLPRSVVLPAQPPAMTNPAVPPAPTMRWNNWESDRRFMLAASPASEPPSCSSFFAVRAPS
jgi:hypothetical protein